MTLRIARVIERSAVNGPGERFVVWVQGCSLRCPGCYNPGLWSKRGGRPVPVAALAARINASFATRGVLRGITISGGEPLEQAAAVAELLGLLDLRLDTIVFTGCSPEEIADDPFKSAVLGLADLVIAGRFKKRLASPSCWTGSSNKAVLALTGRIRPDEWPAETVEVHVGRGGKVSLTGFPDKGLVRRLKALDRPIDPAAPGGGRARSRFGKPRLRRTPFQPLQSLKSRRPPRLRRRRRS